MHRQDEILSTLRETGAFLEGHFLLSSGLHSAEYVQCARLLRFPDKAAALLSVVAEQLRDIEIDVVCGPAMGGILVSYELARLLSKESLFTERVEGKMTLRRGFELMHGAKVLIAEDVVTTGRSTLETKEAIERSGARAVAVACIADRRASDTDIGIPVFSAAKFDIKVYEPIDCPMCRLGNVPTKPGSRTTY